MGGIVLMAHQVIVASSVMVVVFGMNTTNVGGNGEDPENYGSSLVNLAEAYPYFEELVVW